MKKIKLHRRPKRTYSFRLFVETREILEQAAVHSDKTASQYIEEAILAKARADGIIE